MGLGEQWYGDEGGRLKKLDNLFITSYQSDKIGNLESKTKCQFPNVKTSTAIMENSMEVPEKLKIELPYNTTIPFLGIVLEKTLIQKVIYNTQWNITQP